MKDHREASPLQDEDAKAVWLNHLTPRLTGVEGKPPFVTNEAAARLASSAVPDEAARKGYGLPGGQDKVSMVNRDPLNHANFGLLPEEKRRLGSFGVSLAINGLICIAVLVLTISGVHEAHVREQRLKLTYLAEPPKPFVPPVVKVKMPPIPRPEVAKIVPPKVVVEPTPPKLEPLKVETKAPVIPVAAPRPVVQPPAPVVGMFHNSTPAPAAAVNVAEVARPAGFGDPSGVAPNPNANRAANVASVGGFGAANSAAEGSATRRGVVQGAGFGTGVGAGSPNGSARGVVAAVGFGAGTQAAAPGVRGVVSTAGFGSGPAAPSGAVARVQQPVTTSIVVLSKPLPQYTAEAREMHIQGDVTLEVRFTASGQVDVLRVVSGLGHGLDEQARLAAQKIRFKPATRDGKPIDEVSVIHVAFQLA